MVKVGDFGMSRYAVWRNGADGSLERTLTPGSGLPVGISRFFLYSRFTFVL